MEVPYAEFLLTHFRQNDRKWVNRPENKKAAVIVEGNARWQFFPVVQNFHHFLGDDWNLYVFHTNYNAGWLDRMLIDWRVARYKVETPKIDADVFSSLLKNTAFWDVFPEEWVLTFQCDCIACKPLSDEWYAYDFVGSECGINGKIRNGGLSLRNRAKMQEALRRFGPMLADPVEDVFFTKALRLMGAHLPDGFDAVRFCVETDYYELPFGVHGTDKGYHSLTIAEKIVQQIRVS